MFIPPLPQNFAITAAEAQLASSLVSSDGGPTAVGAQLERVDMFFTLLFTAELVVNAYAHWLRPFLADGWNGFDVLVIGLSLAALGPVPLPANAIRTLRAFRVVRLFGRMGGLRDIVASLSAALAPVLNAFLILFFVTAVCEARPARPDQLARPLPGPETLVSRSLVLLFLSLSPSLSLLLLSLSHFLSPSLTPSERTLSLSSPASSLVFLNSVV